LPHVTPMELKAIHARATARGPAQVAAADGCVATVVGARAVPPPTRPRHGDRRSLAARLTLPAGRGRRAVGAPRAKGQRRRTSREATAATSALRNRAWTLCSAPHPW
jgi:hypothetical protein